MFKCFRCGSYYLNQKQELYKGRKKQNTTDKRKNDYCEINLFSGREDISGRRIYAKDIVLFKPDNIYGVVDWNDRRAAFVVYLHREYFKIPYTLLKCQDRSLVRVGSIYEDEDILENKWKKR